MEPKGQYKVQEAPSGRAKCQACKEGIAKGALRLGVLIEHSDYGDWWKWRHWDCVTQQVVENMVDPANLQGLDDLPEEFQDTIHATFAQLPAPKPRKQKSKTASSKDAKATGGKGKSGTARLAHTVDAEVPLPAAAEQPPTDPLEYLRDDLGKMLAVMMGGQLPEPIRPFFESAGAHPGRLSVLISQLQELLVLSTPWPTPEHDAQMRTKYEAAQAAAAATAQEAAAAAAAAHQKRPAKKLRTRGPRGHDSDEE